MALTTGYLFGRLRYFNYVRTPLAPDQVVIYIDGVFKTTSLGKILADYPIYAGEYILELQDSNLLSFKKSPCCHAPVRIDGGRITYCDKCNAVLSGAKCSCGSKLIIRRYNKSEYSESYSLTLYECDNCNTNYTVEQSYNVCTISPVICVSCRGYLSRVGKDTYWCNSCKWLYINCISRNRLHKGGKLDDTIICCQWCRTPYPILDPAKYAGSAIHNLTCSNCGLNSHEAYEYCKHSGQVRDLERYIDDTFSPKVIKLFPSYARSETDYIKDDPQAAENSLHSYASQLKAVNDTLVRYDDNDVAANKVRLYVLRVAVSLKDAAERLGIVNSDVESIMLQYRDITDVP